MASSGGGFSLSTYRLGLGGSRPPGMAHHSLHCVHRGAKLRECVGGAVLTCMHPLGHSFVHVCTRAGLGTRECDFFLQQGLAE